MWNKFEFVPRPFGNVLQIFSLYRDTSITLECQKKFDFLYYLHENLSNFVSIAFFKKDLNLSWISLMKTYVRRVTWIASTHDLPPNLKNTTRLQIRLVVPLSGSVSFHARLFAYSRKVTRDPQIVRSCGQTPQNAKKR